MKKLSSIRAFTIVELLVVIAIIALLTGIILTSLTASKAKSRDAQRVSDVGQIQLAFELYFDRCGQYPQPIVSGSNSYVNASSLSSNSGCPSTNPPITLGSYIGKIPAPPAGAGQTYYDYYVNSGTAATDYVLHAKLEGTSSASPNGLTQAPSYASVITCSSASDSTDYCVGPK